MGLGKHMPGNYRSDFRSYPFGLIMAGVPTKALGFGNPANKAKYNGKEEQRNEFADGGGLEWLDYGARMYNPQICRWQNCDPLADKYTDYSPFNFVSNNPVIYIDPNGKEITPGTNWAGSQYASTFDNLQKNSKTFKQIVKPFVGKKLNYLLHNANIPGVIDPTIYARTSTKSIDKPFADREGHYGDKKIQEGTIQTYFQPIAESKTIDGKEFELNNIGRALTIIHEAIHANKLVTSETAEAAWDQNTAERQHGDMATLKGGRQLIINALTEFNSANGNLLTSEQINDVSFIGMLGTEEGQKFVAQYSKKHFGVDVDDENRADATKRVKGEIYKLIYDEKK